MGKGWSKSELRISTHRHTYAPGEEVQGQISLYLTKSQSALALVLDVCGTEAFTIFPSGASSSQNRSADCLRYTATVYNSPLKKGQYLFPFSFTLPYGLPDSAHLTTQQYTVSVAYTAKVTLPQEQLSAVAEFGVSTPRIAGDEIVSASETFQVRKMCFFHTPLELSATLDKGEYLQTERMIVRVAVSTAECSQAVAGIRLDFSQVTRLNTRLTGQRTFYHLLKSYAVPKAVSAYRRDIDVLEANISLQEVQIQGMTFGRLAQCCFEVCVRVRTEDSLCSEPQEFTIALPVIVRNCVGVLPMSAQYPTEWQPEIMARASFALPPEFAPSAPLEE